MSKGKSQLVSCLGVFSQNLFISQTRIWRYIMMQISGSSVHCSCLKSPTLKNDAYTSGLGGFVPCYVKSLKNNAGASEGSWWQRESVASGERLQRRTCTAYHYHHCHRYHHRHLFYHRHHPSHHGPVEDREGDDQ